MKHDKYKEILIDSLANLTERKKIKVYGFVIMPNHVHLLWEMIDRNGKEVPHASFQKHTAHAIQSDLKINHPNVLAHFKVEEKERFYRFWQRDPLALLIQNREMAEQKLNYMHLNPLQAHWNLRQDPIGYYYSSASFYDSSRSDFSFLSDYRDRV